MTSLRITPRYSDNLWYPILVKSYGGGYCHIIEMQGKEVNEYNRKVYENTKTQEPRPTCADEAWRRWFT